MEEQANDTKQSDTIRIAKINNWPITSLLPTISFFTYTMAIAPGAHHTAHCSIRISSFETWHRCVAECVYMLVVRMCSVVVVCAPAQTFVCMAK